MSTWKRQRAVVYSPASEDVPEDRMPWRDHPTDAVSDGFDAVKDHEGWSFAIEGRSFWEDSQRP